MCAWHKIVVSWVSHAWSWSKITHVMQNYVLTAIHLYSLLNLHFLLEHECTKNFSFWILSWIKLTNSTSWQRRIKNYFVMKMAQELFYNLHCFFFNKNGNSFKICWENYSSSGVVSFRTLPIMLPTVCMNKSLQNKLSPRRRTWTIYEHFFNFQFSVFIGFVYLLPLPLRSQNPLKCLCFVLIKFCAFWRLCGYFNKQPKKLPNTHLPMEVVLGAPSGADRGENIWNVCECIFLSKRNDWRFNCV